MKRPAVTTCALLLACCRAASALNPSLDLNQYAHTAWTVRDGLFRASIYTVAQTSDGYLWLGTELGAVRFDGVRSIPWEPPAGLQLRGGVSRLFGARDGTLWIGTFHGLVSWNGTKLTRYPELDGQVVESLTEARDGTVWAGGMGRPTVGATGLLCAIRSRSTRCYGEDGAFGRTVWASYVDSSGKLWAGADSGLWRWTPAPAQRYPTPVGATPGYSPFSAIDITNADNGRLIMAMRGAGLMQLAGNKVESYPVRGANNTGRLLRDRDGGLWIGTADRGLIHVHRGRTDLFSKSDGLSGNGIFTIFEDREGNIWVGTNGGLDRFRELPVTTISVEQGLSSDAAHSILAARDGAVWVGTQGGLSRWKNGQVTVFRKASGLPDDVPESLFQDDRGRIWAFTRHGLVYLQHGRFVAVNGVPGGDVHYITGDKAGSLWLSEGQSLLHLREGRLVEKIPWPKLGRRQCAGIVLCDPERGGLWLGFWEDGGVAHFKNGQIRAWYTAANGLGEGEIGGLQLDSDGTLWAATEAGGLTRLKDDRIATLTNRTGLPCDTIHWSIEDDDHSLWLYTACGLVRIARTELNAWIADPKRRIQTTVWDEADGVRLSSAPGSPYAPRVAKSNDGKLWFVAAEGVQTVDPRHLPVNQLPPPVHIEQIIADHKIYWQNSKGAAPSNVRLPRRTRDLQIDYTALSLAAPEKVHFKYKLEGQDDDWREVINDRQVQYSNLPPRAYRFRVIACNNSGVWNNQGDALEFSVAPAYYQTNWFSPLCGVVLLGLLWLAYHMRVRQLARDFNLRVEERVNERTRIARDLHDTLLQSFQASLIQMGIARTVLSRRSEEAVEKLDEAIERAENAIAEGRYAIHDLRSQPPAHCNLPKLLTLTGQELASAHGADGRRPAIFRATVEGEHQTIKPLIQDEAYRIGRELLRNAFQHANASEIEAEIRYEERLFRLRVRDDGQGIDPKILEAGSRVGHWGLLGMRERAKRIGGELKIWTQTGAGTEVELSIPSSIAYETGPNARRRLALFQRKRAQS